MTTGSSYARQATNQKQRSFSNDARIMLHESKKLEQRFAYNQQVINNLDTSLGLKIPQNMPSIGNSEQVVVGQGLYQGVANGSSYNDVAEFEIYDRKFKQQVSSAQV